jgi:hypothetical protein
VRGGRGDFQVLGCEVPQVGVPHERLAREERRLRSHGAVRWHGLV